METAEVEQKMIHEQEPTRRGMLREFLEIETGMLRVFSKGASMLEPKEGMEAKWERARKRCKLLREMIQALESEPVRAAMASWQQQRMEEDAEGKPHQLTI
ncbi:MAG: hypothetical protein J6T99_00205 [Oscillospiraceae bacterium]|nr:hypothetical protein [Oscillospiraceae bacterium]